MVKLVGRAPLYHYDCVKMGVPDVPITTQMGTQDIAPSLEARGLVVAGHRVDPQQSRPTRGSTEASALQP